MGRGGVFRRKRKHPKSGKITLSKHFYYWLYERGGQRMVCTHTSDYHEARRMAFRARDSQRARHHPVVPADKTLAAFIDRYLADKRHDVSSVHYDNITAYLTAFKEQHGFLAARDVSSDTIRQFVLERTKGLSAASYNRCLQAIRTFFSWCKRKRWVTENPAASMYLPNRAEAEQPMSVFTKEEIVLLLALAGQSYTVPCKPKNGSRKKRPYTQTYTPPKYLYFFVSLAYFTGMRKSELLRMIWRHVDFDGCSILVPITKNREVRTVYFPPEFGAELRRYRAELAEAGFDNGDDAPVFQTDTGGAVKDPRRAFATLLKLAGLASTPERKLGIHALRHSHGTILLQNGTSLRDVQAMLGHKRITTTERYLHASAEKHKQAVRALRLG